MFNHSHRTVQNFFRTPIIHIEQHLLSSRIILLKVQHNLRTRTPKMVDGLVIVSHDEQVFSGFRQKSYHIVLNWIDILKFVYQYIGKPLLPGPSDICSLPQKFPGVQEHIVKIQQSEGSAFLLISQVDLPKNLIWAVLGIVILQFHPVSFYHADFPPQFFQKFSFLAQFFAVLFHQLPQKLFLLFLAQNIPGIQTVGTL